MESNEKNQWFSRVFNFETPLYCPRCGTRLAVDPIFDHDPHVCLSCHAPLIEWNMLSVTYLIDVENAPDIVKEIIKHLSNFTEQEAFHQLLSLLQFLHVHEIIDLYGKND